MTPAEEEALRMKTYDLDALTPALEAEFEYRWTRLPGFGENSKNFARLFYRAAHTDARRKEVARFAAGGKDALDIGPLPSQER